MKNFALDHVHVTKSAETAVHVTMLTLGTILTVAMISKFPYQKISGVLTSGVRRSVSAVTIVHMTLLSAYHSVAIMIKTVVTSAARRTSSVSVHAHVSNSAPMVAHAGLISLTFVQLTILDQATVLRIMLKRFKSVSTTATHKIGNAFSHALQTITAASRSAMIRQLSVQRTVHVTKTVPMVVHVDTRTSIATSSIQIYHTVWKKRPTKSQFLNGLKISAPNHGAQTNINHA